MKENNKKLIVLILISIGICIIGVIAPFFVRYNIKIDGLKPNEVASFIGDTITPFFSLASIILVIGTLILQRQDLIYQHNEIEQSKKEIEKQNNTIELQRFENTFFNLLNSHTVFINEIDIETDEFEFINEKYYKKNIRRKEYFKYIYKKLNREWEKESKNIDYDFWDSSMQRDVIYNVEKAFKSAYEKVFNDNQDYIGVYFRSIYHIIKFVDRNSFLDDEEKRYYISLVRAKLSNYELILIFYNSVSSFGKDKFKKLIDKYDILKNLDYNLLLHETHKWSLNY